MHFCKQNLWPLMIIFIYHNDLMQDVGFKTNCYSVLSSLCDYTDWQADFLSAICDFCLSDLNVTYSKTEIKHFNDCELFWHESWPNYYKYFILFNFVFSTKKHLDIKQHHHSRHRMRYYVCRLYWPLYRYGCQVGGNYTFFCEWLLLFQC